MADDEYIPEPDDWTTRLWPTLERPCGHCLPLRPRAPQVDDLEAALQVWTTERAVVQRFLKQELRANVDYYTLRIGGKDSKPSLSKAGAEKVLGWLKLQASFVPDTGTWEMLGTPTGPGVLRVHLAHPQWRDCGRRTRRTVTEEGRRRREQGDQDGGEVGHGECGPQNRRPERSLHPGSGRYAGGTCEGP